MTGALFVALLVSRLAAAWPHMSTEPLGVPTDGRTLSADVVTYDMPAYNLLAGNGYSNCLAPPYEPGVMRTPTYPLVLAAIYATLGRTAAAVVGANVVFDLLTALLLFAVARRRLPAWWAIGFLGAVVVVAPWSEFLRHRLTEPLATMLVAAVLWLCAPSPRLGRWLALGLCLGALVMCRPIFFLLPVVIALWAITLARSRFQGRAGWVLAAMFVGVMAVWGPWVARNALVFDRFMPLSPGGSGLSLWVGTWHDGGPRWRIRRDRTGAVKRTLPAHAFASAEERERVVPLFDRYIELYFSNGGIALTEPNSALRDIAIEKIRAEPLAWLTLRARRTALLLEQRYFGARLVRSKTGWRIAAWAIGFLALIGTVFTIWRVAWQPVTIVFLYTWLIHFPTHDEIRYLMPAYGAVMLLAVLALQVIQGRLVRLRRAEERPARR
jgi:hypothetical protein